ncbi:primosomal protein N' [Thalassotalea piscium]|uniref:Replication restart protein PriA n=1 Tax=Thalassotalea piscium TaxID=1230533 RepID=A0A7X0NJM0_9GAMM|nr:primosomal protein N' [Thalassotalea piscium]MBB6544659.1 primosomal protein N' (replication factor Y) [Thalassotalea piscium]
MQEHFIQVAIPVPMRQLFTYKLPKNIALADINIGQRVIVPFSHRTVVAIVISTNQQLPGEINANKIKPIISVNHDKTQLPSSLLSLLSLCANYYQHPIGEVVQKALPALLRKIETPNTLPNMQWLTTNDANEDELAKIAKKAPKQHQLYQLLLKQSGLSWSELRTLGYSKAQLTALEQKHLIKQEEVVNPIYNWHEGLNQADKLSLSTEQAIIVSAITNTMDSFACHLIDGVTGSGKTEVYLQAMEHTIANNQQVLVLVPEIGLTPQTLSRFELRFNVPIFLHHSGLNDTERLITWQQAHQGGAAIVIGTRSAVFSPLQRLGLIIIDEEHDSSFKQQDSFRYHARDIAILRARQQNIPIVLGTATPSFETLHNALEKKYQHHKLTQRAGNSIKSKIHLIDIANQPLTFGLAKPVIEKINQTLSRKEQVLVFLNRRGFAPAINCQECHWLAQCLRCNKPYTFHKGQGLLICHHCAGQKRLPAQCPDCGSVRVSPIGQGTEQIEQHLQQKFEQYSVIRIDRDSTRRKGELAKILKQVMNKEHQILVGTQMLAKGHHFPDVTLVVMLDIDGALFSYDFRAAEHMAQLLIQVAGRAGRASKPGKVLVQTQYPQHPLLQDLVHNGYRHFAKQAMLERQYAGLPPFGYQALIRAEANFPSYPEKFLRSIASLHFAHCEVAGPMPAAMEKRAGKYRFHLLIQAKKRSYLHKALTLLLECADNNEWSSKVRWSMDIDPLELSW